jgi:hypothetical protein
MLFRWVREARECEKQKGEVGLWSVKKEEKKKKRRKRENEVGKSGLAVDWEVAEEGV